MLNPGVAVAKQALAVNKTLAENGFRTLAMLQERSEGLTRSFLIPSGSSKSDTLNLLEGWSETVHTGREACKEVVDLYFNLLEGVLFPSDPTG